MDEIKELREIFLELGISYWKRDDVVIYLVDGQVVMQLIQQSDEKNNYEDMNKRPVGR